MGAEGLPTQECVQGHKNNCFGSVLVDKGKISLQEWKIKVTLNRGKQEASSTSLPPSPHQIKHSGILRKLGH